MRSRRRISLPAASSRSRGVAADEEEEGEPPGTRGEEEEFLSPLLSPLPPRRSKPMARRGGRRGRRAEVEEVEDEEVEGRR